MKRGGGIGVLLIIGLAFKFWPYLLAILLIWMAVNVGRRWRDRWQAAVAAKAASDAEISRRADAENRAMQCGDVAAGMYGQYQPPEGVM